MRSLVLLLCLASCARTFVRLDTPEPEPAFLGDASGLYLARHATSAAPPRVSTVVQVDRTILLTLGEVDAVTEGLSIFGQLDDNGVLIAAADLRVADVMPHVEDLFPALGETLVPTDASIAIGFDTVTITLQLKDSPGRQAICTAYTSVGLASECAPLTQPIVYIATKTCDFDARLSGVYRALVKVTDGPGFCGGSTGTRDLVVVLTNATTTAALFLVDRGTVENAALLSYDPSTQTLTSPPGAPFSINAKISIGDTLVSFEATTASPDCSYTITADRPVGDDSGLLCTRFDLCQELESAACPTVPQGVQALFAYEARAEVGFACQIPICKVTLPTSQACTPTAPALTVGCPNTTTTVITAGKTAGGAPCYEATCVSQPDCATLAGQESLFPDTCNPQAFVVRSVLGCSFTGCP